MWLKQPFYAFCRAALALTFRLFFGLRVEGREHVPAGGALIVASNHASYLDPPVLAVAVTRILWFMARRSLFARPVFGGLIRRLNAFPLDREGDSRDALRRFGELLERDQAVLLFPEGTRSQNGKLGEVRSGVGMLAVRSGAAVLPVYVWGTYHAWPRHAERPGRHRLKVLIGEPVVPRPCKTRRERRGEQERVTEAAAAALRALEARAWAGEAPPPAVPAPEDAGETPSSGE